MEQSRNKKKSKNATNCLNANHNPEIWNKRKTIMMWKILLRKLLFF